jgi:hypothetical protein
MGSVGVSGAVKNNDVSIAQQAERFFVLALRIWLEITSRNCTLIMIVIPDQTIRGWRADQLGI